MSLHLIESRAPSRVFVLRRPGGNMASVVMHGSLVTLAVLATSSPPTFAFERPVQEKHTIYVAPAQTPVARTASAPSSSSNAPAQYAPLMPFVAPVNIPVDIPAVPEISTGATDVDMRSGARNSGGVPNGSPTGTPQGSGSGNDVFSEPQVDRAVMLLPGMPIPRYPDYLRSAGVQDTVVTSFVVDANGRVELESVHFPSSANVGFSNAITESLRRARFRPAEVAGRSVRQKVEQAFIFSLTR